MKPYSEYNMQVLDIANTLRKQADQRRDDAEKKAVAERLVLAMRVPPNTRRAAAQFQGDIDLWRFWCSRGEAPPLPSNVTLPAKAAKKPKLKTIKPGPGFQRSEEWQARGVPKRRQRVVIYSEVQLSDNYDIAEIHGVPTLIKNYDEHWT